jgi:nitrogen fixation/metabolism regulation signal transduction histidine kinase
MEEQQQGQSDDSLRKLKHDIKNQLSNIYLALEQLKYEMPEASADCLFYLDTISTSSIQINNLLNDTE